MSEIAALVTAIGVILGGVGMGIWRVIELISNRPEAQAEQDEATIKTVTSLRESLALRNQQVEAQQDLIDRQAAIISQQDIRMERKDARILHLERTLDDSRGVSPR